MYPKFATATVSFSQRGPGLCRLAGRLPRRILLTAIRDQRLFLSRAYAEVDSYWRRLRAIILDSVLWNRLVLQKDEFFYRCCSERSLRLRRKFSALFAPRWKPDTSYYCDTATKVTQPPEKSEDAKRERQCQNRTRESEYSWSQSERRFERDYQGRLEPLRKEGEEERREAAGTGSRTSCSGGQSGEGRSLRSDTSCFGSQSGEGRPLNSSESTTQSRTSYSISESREGGLLDVAFVEEQSWTSESQSLDRQRRLSETRTSDSPSVLDGSVVDERFERPRTRILKPAVDKLSKKLHFEDSDLESDFIADMSRNASLIIPQSENIVRPLSQGHGSEPKPEFGPLNFGSYIPVIQPQDPRLEGEIVNLSSLVLTTEQIEVLKLGLQFRKAPPKVPFSNIIPGVETAAREMARTNPADASAFRVACIKELDRASTPKGNMSKRQSKVLRELRNNQLITITSADKGGKTVIVDSTQYGEMCLVHLSDVAYVSVEKFGASKGRTVLVNPKTGLKTEELLNTSFVNMDPSDIFLRQQCRRLLTLLNKLKRDGDVSSEDRKRLIPCQPYSGAWPRFYGLPKVHKSGPLRIRPIVTTKGLYCDSLALHMKKILNCALTGARTVQNSYQLIELLDFFEFQESDFLLSFDVESLYTRVPVVETLVIVREKLENWKELDELSQENEDELHVCLSDVTSLSVNGIMKLLELMMSDVFFIWDSRLYHQTKGLPMGGRLSPILANLFMENLENQVLRSYLIAPRLYIRYVDDILIVWDISLGDFRLFLDHYNAQHQDINLTVEEEKDGQLPFLDVLIQRPVVSTNGKGRREYSLSVYRKPTHSHRYLHFRSAVPKSLKKNTLRALWLRAQRLLKRHKRPLQEELKYLRDTFICSRNAYPIEVVDKWLASFQMELDQKPEILRLPNKAVTKRRDIDKKEDQEKSSTSTEDENGAGGEQVEEKRVKCVTQYAPGIGDSLRRISASFNLESWHTYGKKVQELLGTTKTLIHCSKSMCTVYGAKCLCGTEYIGESNRNLKVRLLEHTKKNSDSTFTDHLFSGAGHELIPEQTVVFGQERHPLKRKILETIHIRANSANLCNDGPSVDLESAWDGCLQRATRELSKKRRIDKRQPE